MVNSLEVSFSVQDLPCLYFLVCIKSTIISCDLDGAELNGHVISQRHPSNWVDADEEDDEGDETDLCVRSTPPYYEE